MSSLGAVLLVATQAACGAPEAVFGGLAKRYHEVPVFAGRDQDGPRAVLTLSPAGTWSVVLVGLRDGVPTACIIQAGNEAMTQMRPGEKT